jgi:hypothetical protein
VRQNCRNTNLETCHVCRHVRPAISGAHLGRRFCNIFVKLRKYYKHRTS